MHYTSLNKRREDDNLCAGLMQLCPARSQQFSVPPTTVTDIILTPFSSFVILNYVNLFDCLNIGSLLVCDLCGRDICDL